MTWWGYGVFDGDIPLEVRQKCFEILQSDTDEIPDLQSEEVQNVQCSRSLRSSELNRMIDYCYEVRGYDPLVLSSSLAVVAEFVIQNLVPFSRDKWSKIQRPIVFERDHIFDMGWENHGLRLQAIGVLIERLDRRRRPNLRQDTNSNTRTSSATRPRPSPRTARQSAMEVSPFPRLYRRRHLGDYNRGQLYRFELTNEETNTNKFWEVQPFLGGWNIRYGRIGSVGRERRINGSLNDLRRLIQAKLQNGYYEVSVSSRRNF